jgi:hypothetical protein
MKMVAELSKVLLLFRLAAIILSSCAPLAPTAAAAWCPASSSASGQAVFAQLTPPKPSRQMQVMLTHFPLPRQSSGQAEQSVPVYQAVLLASVYGVPPSGSCSSVVEKRSQP